MIGSLHGRKIRPRRLIARDDSTINPSSPPSLVKKACVVTFAPTDLIGNVPADVYAGPQTLGTKQGFYAQTQIVDLNDNGKVVQVVGWGDLCTKELKSQIAKDNKIAQSQWNKTNPAVSPALKKMFAPGGTYDKFVAAMTAKYGVPPWDPKFKTVALGADRKKDAQFDKAFAASQTSPQLVQKLKNAIAQANSAFLSGNQNAFQQQFQSWLQQSNIADSAKSQALFTQLSTSGPMPYQQANQFSQQLTDSVQASMAQDAKYVATIQAGLSAEFGDAGFTEWQNTVNGGVDNAYSALMASGFSDAGAGAILSKLGVSQQTLDELKSSNSSEGGDLTISTTLHGLGDVRVSGFGMAIVALAVYIGLSAFDGSSRRVRHRRRISRNSGVRVVFEHANGYVTDFGRSLKMYNREEKGPLITTLPRYAVWKKDSSGRSRIVSETNDLESAKRRAGSAS